MLKQFGAKRFVLPEFSCSSVCVSSVLLHHHKITSIKSRYQVSSLPPVSFYKVLPQIHVVATPISNYQNLVQSTRDTLHCHQLHFIHHCSSERPQKNSLIVKSNKNYRNKIAQELTMESAEATGDSGTENRLNISHENTDNAENIKNELKIPQELLDKWEREQLELKKQMILEDSSVITEIMSSCNQNNTSKEFFIGGVDISFVKDDFENACAAFVVLNFPQLEVVYENYEMIKMTAPYIPGFLALREVPFLIDMYNKLKSTHPQFIPHVIMVDGNGILHPREFGLACHLGVLLDTPCIGVAKNLFQVDGILKNKENNEKLTKGGDTYELVGTSGKILGKALRGTCSTNPVYVSTGHRITLDMAVELVYRCCKHRVPEPTRQADLRSREYLRNHFGPDSESKKKGQKKQTTKTKSVKNNKQTVTNCEVKDNVEELLSSCSIFDENKT